MRVRLALVATGIAIPSWVALIVLLGNVDLQRSVSRGLFLPLERPVLFVAIGLIALAAAFVGARMAGIGRSELVALLACLTVVNLVGAAAATFVIGELELQHTPIVFVVLSAHGALFLGGILGAWLGVAAAG